MTQAKFRPLKFGVTRVEVRDGQSGTHYLKAEQALQDFPDRMTDRLRHWAEQEPERTMFARRVKQADGSLGDWRHISYQEAWTTARNIAQGLIDRGLNAERPVAILSENSLEHAMLALGCMLAGVPFVPTSPPYSLISVDYDKLKHVLKTVTPALVFAQDERYAKAITATMGDDIEVVMANGSVPGRTTTSFAQLCAVPATDAVDRAIAAADVANFAYMKGDNKRALEAARGPQAASSILLRALPASNSIDAVRELSQMDTRQIFNIIKNEQPQTVAFIMSYLDARQVSQIIPLFSPEAREEIVERLGTMDSISSELINKVLKSLGKHLSSGPQQYSMHRRGGAQAAAQLLKSLDKELGKTLLSRIEERNTELGEAIRKRLFSFEDIAFLSQRDVQRLLRDVETQDLAVALKSGSEPVRRAFFGAMSKRAAESLKEEMEIQGPVRNKDVEAAQERIIAQIMQLSEAGEIDISTEDTGDSVG
jgi:flagellar motor switch protein FliG